RDGRATLVVQDSGIGIPKEFLPRIFEPLAQAKIDFSSQSGGLGLGLSLAKRLVEMHGGEITAHSEGVEKGSKFVVSFPLLSHPQLPEEVPTTKPGAGLKVVLIEDNEDLRESTRELLQALGLKVESAAGAREGVELALKMGPDAALVDLALP